MAHVLVQIAGILYNDVVWCWSFIKHPFVYHFYDTRNEILLIYGFSLSVYRIIKLCCIDFFVCTDNKSNISCMCFWWMPTIEYFSLLF